MRVSVIVAAACLGMAWLVSPAAAAQAEDITLTACTADGNTAAVHVRNIVGTVDGEPVVDVFQDTWNEVAGSMSDDVLTREGYRAFSLTVGHRLIALADAGAEFSDQFQWWYGRDPIAIVGSECTSGDGA